MDLIGPNRKAMRSFNYYSPKTLTEAIDLLSTYGTEAKIMAGGTDLLIEIKEEVITPKYIIDLKRIADLNKIEYHKNNLSIGALVTIREVETSPLISRHLRILAEAAFVLGSLQIRNKGTIGGNLCHASPSADLAPPLIALDAKLCMLGKSGERREALENFFIGPGLTILNPDEILIEIQVPIPSPNTNGTYLKFSPRKAMDLAVVGVATLITLDSSNLVCTQARIVLGAVAPTPIRAKVAEKLLEGKKIDESLVKKVSSLVAEESRPISDIRGSAWYRKEIVKVLVQRSIFQTIEKIRNYTLGV